MSTPTITIETITPLEAERLLEHNTSNRVLRPHRIEQYANEMASGKWMLTGEPIIVNGTNLINGQHRLHACMKAGVPFTTAVFRGADAEIYSVVDSGMIRSSADTLRHEGFVNSTQVAAGARLVIAYRGHALNDFNKASQLATRQAILEEATGNRDRYASLASQTSHVRREGYNPTAFIGCGVLLGYLVGDDEADEWMSGALSGVGMEEGDPRLALRRWVVSIKRATYPVHLSAWVRARNAYVKNESRSIIKAWFKGSSFPRFDEEGS